MAARPIPIENIYYLLAYAWDALEEAELSQVALDSEMSLAELLGRVLAGGVTHQLKRGLDRSYVGITDEIPGIRGRLDVTASVKRNSFIRSRAVCAFDELSPDVLHNRIVKSTLRGLLALPLPDPLRDQLRDLHRRMAGVTELRVTGTHFGQIVLGRNNAYYRFLLNVCELVHRNLLAAENGADTRFRDFTRDDRQMAALFERFLRNFYRRERPDLSVSAPRFQWHAVGEPTDLEYLPEMRTDIVLRRADDCVVVDAKYYAESLGERFSKASLHSENLYQIFTYMSHLGLPVDRSKVGGLLIYPRTTESLRVRATLFGHPFLAATVNLGSHWRNVRAELLSFIDEGFSPISPVALRTG